MLISHQLAVRIYGLLQLFRSLSLDCAIFVGMLKPNAKLPKMLFLMPENIYFFYHFLYETIFYLNTFGGGAYFGIAIWIID